MKTFNKFINEATKISTDRYVRSHGKKPSPKTRGLWFFTSKRMGDPSDAETFQKPGIFIDAAKAAKAWGAENGHSMVYVME